MATINLPSATELPNSLKDFMLFSELTPGDEPSYQACKAVYVSHPLGAKMAETPITMAQSQERKLSVPGAPSAALERFTEEFNALGATEAIRQTKVLSRVYGIATCGVIAEGVPPDRPLTAKQLADLRIAFNIWDPLNTAGSLVFNQNPNALDFLKQGQHVAVSGQSYHPTRTQVVINERPIFLAYTPAAFGFVGRSVYQRAWYPLKSYLKTLTADDMIATKSGVIVAKIKMPGSIVDNVMATAFGQKRNVVKEAEIGNVINITPDEEITSLDLMNMEGPMRMARENILKNCAVSGDMPAVLLNEETYVEGFGEGTEDARRVAMFVKRMREEMNPQYEWFDNIVKYRAWTPEYYATIQKRFPEVYGKISYTQAFYSWKNGFRANWPNWLEEEDSEKIRTEEVILQSAIAAAQTLLPISDPENQVAIVSWLSDTINDQETLYKTPLEFDTDALEKYLQEQKKKQEKLEKQAAAGAQGEGGEGGGGPFQAQKVPKPKSEGIGDAASGALNKLHDLVNKLPDKHAAKDDARNVIKMLAAASGVRPNGNGAH